MKREILTYLTTYMWDKVKNGVTNKNGSTQRHKKRHRVVEILFLFSHKRNYTNQRTKTDDCDGD